MKITVINGTEKHGVTYRLKEMFLEPFRGKAEITEFYLPKDGPGFCIGCTQCFLTRQDLCKDADRVQKIEKAMIEADLLVFQAAPDLHRFLQGQPGGPAGEHLHCVSRRQQEESGEKKLSSPLLPLTKRDDYARIAWHKRI